MQKAFFFSKFVIFAPYLIENNYEFSRNSWSP